MKLSARQIATVIILREVNKVPWNEIAFIITGLCGEKIHPNGLYAQVTTLHPELKGNK